MKLSRSWVFSGLTLLSIQFLHMTAIPAAPYSGGAGTEADPYRISTPTDLLTLANPANSADWSKCFLMTANIDMTGITTFTPIGDNSIQFTGVFDGGGHVVQNLVINLPTQNLVGFFGWVNGASAMVKNLGMQNESISGNSWTGGLAGGLSASIIDCYMTGTVTGASQYTGGLVGATGGTIISCYASGSVAGNIYVGGVTGWNSGIINACYSTVLVSGTERLGGLSGKNDRSVCASFWDVETSGQSWNSGGTGLSTLQMKSRTTFQNAGWAFHDWVMTEGDYPRLAWEGTGGTPFSALFSGTGSESDPCLISTTSDLITLANAPGYWAASFRMMNNIDMTGISDFFPIGRVNSPFTGVFDGGNHVLLNLTMNLYPDNFVGVFGSVYGASCQIKNLGIKDGSFSGNNHVGGLVGYNGGAILRCFSTSSVTGIYRVGGLAGENHGTLANCYATGPVSGNEYVCGLAGFNGSGTVVACYASNSVTCTGDLYMDLAGGLVRYNNFEDYLSSRVEVSFWDMETSGRVKSDGGTGLTSAQMRSVKIFQNAGWAAYDWVMAEGQLPRLAWEGTGEPAIPAPQPVPLPGSGRESDPYRISTATEFASLSGHVSILDKYITLTSDIDFRNISLYPIGDLRPFNGVFDGAGHVLANVTIHQPLRDFVGVFSLLDPDAEIRNVNLAHCVVHGRDEVGGLVGAMGGTSNDMQSGNGSTVKGCSVNGAIMGNEVVGGLVGGAIAGEVTDSWTMGIVSGTGNYCGGLMGGSMKLNMTDCYSHSSVSGYDDVGGLLGSSNMESIIENCYATGNVTGHDNVGGLVGIWGPGMVTSCYATGNVTGHNYIGGLIGTSGKATSCYSIGSVSGNSFVGGLMGTGRADFCYATGSVSGYTNLGGLIGYGSSATASFWDTTMGGPDNGVGSGLPTAQMRQRATFESAGWDFTGPPPVWSIFEGQSYPLLTGLPMPIDSIATLQVLSTVSSGSYILTRDLDARETKNWSSKSTQPGFLPIGTSAQPFNGTLDGGGHRILDLHIYRPTLDNVGLFGYIGASGVVRGIGLEATDITGRNQTGGLAGVNLGTVNQCYVLGGITGANNVGGLIGQNGGTVRESYAAATLLGTSTGGLIGADAGGGVSASFWDTLVSGTTYSGGGTGLITASLYQNLTYASAGWDMFSLWTLAEGYSYPFFQSSMLLRVLTEPPRLINADSLDIPVETYVPNLFVTIGGGDYPAYRNILAASEDTLTVPLKQEAINNLIISAVSETGAETVVAHYTVYESAQFPSSPTVVTALSLQPASVSLAAGASQQFTCRATFADNSIGDVTPVASWNIVGGSITTAGLYTGTGTVLALLNTEQGWIYSNTATITPAKSAPISKANTGRVSGVVLSHYTGLGLAEARVTTYNLLNPTVQAQHSVYDAFGNYTFFINEGKYHFEGSCPGHRSVIYWGGHLLESSELLNPGPPAQWTEPYYSGQVKANRPLSHDFSLRPNDTGAPWVVFIEPVANTTVNTDHVVVTAIDADKYSELAVAKYTHNTVDYDIPDKISSTGFYRDTWALKLGVNVLHLYTMDTESNASEKTIQITYDPDYNTPGGDDDNDGLPNQWETDHGLDPASASGVNGATGDLDNDTLTNLEEYRRGTLPNSPNSDSDTLTDDFEVQLGTNPLEPDTDGDGVNDDIEWQRGSDPLHDDRIKMTIVNLKDSMSVRGDAVTLLAETLPGYNPALVASVSIEVNGAGTGNAWRVLGTPSTTPFTATWDTTAYPAGSYRIRAVACSLLGYIDSEPQSIVVSVSPTAPYFERIRSGQHRLTAPVPLVSQTVLALRAGTRFAKITIPAGALASDDTLTAFFPDPSSFTPSFPSLQQDARLYLDLTLVSHTGPFLGGKRATIEMNYPDADLDDHLDGSGLRVPFLSMRYLPTPTSAFIPLVSSTLDRSNRCIRGETTHFSTFGIIEEQPAPPLNLLTTSLPQGTVGAPYTAFLDADGGAPPYIWTVTDGVLPEGLSIVGNTLTGIPATPGSFPITLQVADAQVPPFTASRVFTLDIFAADQPTVTLSLHPGQSSITNTLSAWWDITFSEPVSGFDTGDVILTGTASPGATYEVAGSGASYTLEVKTLTRDGTLHPTVPSGKAASIATGAPNRASVNEQEIWVDRTKPKVQITSVYSGLQYYGTSGSIILKTLPILFTLAFDESVTGLADAGINFTGLTPQPDFHVYGIGKNYTLLITNADAGSVLTPALLADAAQDAAGNGMADTAYSGREVRYIPETRATVTLNQQPTQADPAKTFPVYYDIVFSAPVTGFETSDVVSIGTALNPTYDVSGNGATYTLTVANATGDGRLAFRIPENVTMEGNAASTSTDNMVTYDATPPAITLGAPSSSKTRQGPVSFSIIYTGAKTISLSPADVLLEGVPAATIAVTGTGTQNRIVTLFGITGAGTLGIRLKPGTAVDAAGNLAAAAGPSATVEVDPRLTVTVEQSPGQRDPNNHLPLYFDIEFVEDVSGFAHGDITFGGSATGITYELTGSDASYVLKITAVDAPGTISPRIEEGVCQGMASGALNAPSTSADNTILYDPELALAFFAVNPASGPAPLTVQFTDQSIPGTLPIDAWEWDFGDGSTSGEQNPKHLYSAPGHYTVTLTVTTPAGSTPWTLENGIHVQSSMPLLNGMALLLLSALLCLAGYSRVRHRAIKHGDQR